MIVHTGIMKSGTTWLEFMVAALTNSKIVQMAGSQKWPPDILRRFLELNRLNSLSIRDHFRPSAHALFQELRLPVIFVYRHPADIVTSLHWHCIRHWPDQYDGEFGKTLDYFQGVADAIGWRSLPNVFVTRYEDLSSNPTGVLARLGDYLGTPFDPETIRHTVEYFSFERMFQRKRGIENQDSRGRKGIVGDHGNFLTAERLRMWNERYPRIAEAWGYGDEMPAGGCGQPTGSVAGETSSGGLTHILPISGKLADGRVDTEAA